MRLASTWRGVVKANGQRAATRVIADRLSPTLRRQFLAAIAALEGAVDVDALLAAVRSRDALGVEQAIRLAELPAHLKPAAQTILQAFEKSGVVSAGQLGDLLDVGFTFDLSNPAAEQWMRQSGAAFVTDLSDAARRMIREVIASGLQNGLTADEMARIIRLGIGLTDRQQNAVIAYRNDLIAAGRSAEAVERLTARYAQQLVNYRARLIARHETILASNQGQRQAWDQAKQRGLIQPERTRKVWDTAEDERTCPRCEPMDGQEVAFEGEPFVTGDGDTVDAPPAHVSCRCAVGLKFL